MLYEHQKKIVDADPKRTGLFLGTGSGKTRIALLLSRGSTLVICPKTQKEDMNWEREAASLDLRIPITVISKESFRRDHVSLQAFDTVIVDECHTVLGMTPNTRQRNRVTIPKSSQLYEALIEYLNRTQPLRVYLCTATIAKSPMTVYAAAQVLLRPDVTGSFYDFRDRFYQKLPMPGREVYIAKSDTHSKDALARLVRSIGYTGRLEDYFDVPEQTHRVVNIPLTILQEKRIKELPFEYPDPIVRIGKQNQVENGVLAGDEFSAAESFPTNKIDKILELSEEFSKLVVFAKYTNQILALKSALVSAGKTVFTLAGDTKDRGSLMEQAKLSSSYIFIAQSQISAGWELPDCPVMVFASKTFSFVDLEQSYGRIQRANHIKPNLYIHLVSHYKGSIDQSVHNCVMNKKDFSDRIYLNI